MPERRFPPRKRCGNHRDEAKRAHASTSRRLTNIVWRRASQIRAVLSSAAVTVLALIQLHSSLAGGNSGQGWMDDVLVPAPPLDPDAALDADAPLDPVARLDP
jgi:hypothetical protein